MMTTIIAPLDEKSTSLRGSFSRRSSVSNKKTPRWSALPIFQELENNINQVTGSVVSHKTSSQGNGRIISSTLNNGSSPKNT